AGYDPAEQRGRERAFRADAYEDGAGREEGTDERGNRDPVRAMAHHPAEEHIDQRARERERGNQPERGHRSSLPPADGERQRATPPPRTAPVRAGSRRGPGSHAAPPR